MNPCGKKDTDWRQLQVNHIWIQNERWDVSTVFALGFGFERKKDWSCESGSNMKEITQIWRGEAVETGTGSPSQTAPRARGVVRDVLCGGGSSNERVTRGDEGGCNSGWETRGPIFLPTLLGTDSMFLGRDAVKNIPSFTSLRMARSL